MNLTRLIPGALVLLAASALTAFALVLPNRPTEHYGLTVASDPAPAPWVVDAPTYGSDRTGNYVEYGFHYGDATTSIPASPQPGWIQKTIPVFDTQLGTLFGMKAGLDIETDWNPQTECDLDDDYPTAGVECKVAGSWKGSAHGWSWPGPDDIGQPGDAWWSGSVRYNGTVLAESEDVAPIYYALADQTSGIGVDQFNFPESQFDGTDDAAGTSGGSNPYTDTAEDLVWGALQNETGGSLGVLNVSTPGKGWVTANGPVVYRVDYAGHGVLNGAFRYYYN